MGPVLPGPARKILPPRAPVFRPADESRFDAAGRGRSSQKKPPRILRGGNAVRVLFCKKDSASFAAVDHVHDLADAVQVVGVVIVDVDPSLAVVADEGNLRLEGVTHPLDEIF